MEDIIISVIVPVYNVEKYLVKCVKSILCQTFTAIEIILVDDGSVDSSGEICEQLKKEDERIVVIHQKNEGLSGARNKGIENARGQYLSFIDSDDYIAPEMLEVLYNNLVRENAEISICGLYQCFEGKEPYINEKEYMVLTNEEAIKLIFYGGKLTVNAVNKLYKRELFETVQYPKGKTAEDAFVIIELMLQCNKIVATTEQYYYYYHREDSITTRKFSVKNLDVIEAYEQNYKLIEKKCPNLCLVGMSALLWAHFVALDKMLYDNCEIEYKQKMKELVCFLRKHCLDVLKTPYLTKGRKVSMLVLKISVRGYKKIVKYNRRKNMRLNQ